jgi:chromosome segregation ATPase
MSRLSVPIRHDRERANSKLLGQKKVCQYDELYELNRELRLFGIQASRDAQDAEDELKKTKMQVKSLLAEVNVYRARERKTTRTANPQPGMLHSLQEQLDAAKTAAVVKNEKTDKLQRHLVEVIREQETHIAALIQLKNEQSASLEIKRQRNAELEQRNAELEEKIKDYQTHNASLEKRYDALQEHTGNLQACFRYFEEDVEDTKEQNAVLEAQVKLLEGKNTENMLWLAKAETKVHELENAQAEVLNDDLGAKLHKLKLTGFFCPISLALMSENAVVAPDGYSYNENELQKWFEKEKTSPMTRQVMPEGTIKNRALMTVIQELMNLIKPVSDTGANGAA